MTSMDIPIKEIPKFAAAKLAVESVSDGMNLGLGTGSTAYWFVLLLAERMKTEGLKVVCVTTSTQTAELASFHDIPLTSLNDVVKLDLVVDGADEISPELDLIKGGGGALLQEKIVANASEQMIVIADDSKFVQTMGKFHLPVEVVKFGWKATAKNIRDLLNTSRVLSTELKIREHDMKPFSTDEGNYIIDCYCERIDDPARLSLQLNQIPGVVENGLFIGMADTIMLGNKQGEVRIIDRDKGDLGLSQPQLPIDFQEME